jgi:signal transduction histidine kinase
MRRRLIVTIAGVAAVAVVLFAVPLALVIQRTYRDEELLRLQRDTVAATRAIDISSGGDAIELPPGFSSLSVFGRDGRRLAGRGGPATADDVVREALSGARPADRVRDGRLVAAVPLVNGERVTGAVRAERPDSAATSATRDMWWTLAAVAAAVVGLAVLAALIAGRRLARPLERVAIAARRLGHGDFTVRAPRSGVREVDDVAAALDAAAERLDDLVSRGRAVSAAAAHQLRTPLAALRLELEAIELRGDAPPELPAALAQVDRVQNTVETLLAVARDAPRSPAVTPLEPLLDEAEARWRGPLAAEGRALRLHVDAPGVAAQVSGPVLREILDVLLDNAHRHGAGAVEIHVRSAGGSPAVEVADEGGGLRGDPEDAFARRAATGDGHGIGLALARSLAHAEGGRLTVTRAAPRPVFTLLLRAATAAPTSHRDGRGSEPCGS